MSNRCTQNDREWILSRSARLVRNVLTQNPPSNGNWTYRWAECCELLGPLWTNGVHFPRAVWRIIGAYAYARPRCDSIEALCHDFSAEKENVPAAVRNAQSAIARLQRAIKVATMIPHIRHGVEDWIADPDVVTPWTAQAIADVNRLLCGIELVTFVHKSLEVGGSEMEEEECTIRFLHTLASEKDLAAWKNQCKKKPAETSTMDTDEEQDHALSDDKFPLQVRFGSSKFEHRNFGGDPDFEFSVSVSAGAGTRRGQPDSGTMLFGIADVTRTVRHFLTATTPWALTDSQLAGFIVLATAGPRGPQRCNCCQGNNSVKTECAGPWGPQRCNFCQGSDSVKSRVFGSLGTSTLQLLSRQ